MDGEGATIYVLLAIKLLAEIKPVASAGSKVAGDLT
jgi:hypothetical protein